ncbi:peptidoglycan-binding protein [Leifsonia sp. NPDC058230]|uniref:peptidoglycan-binding protein n=1 Tax=Leifsonia sp. NPDC058230 TaxID=3346391 RepID=UPI0036DDC270
MIIALLTAISVGSVTWASAIVISATSALPSQKPFATVTAANGTIELTLPLRAEARWERMLVARNMMQGTVTSLDLDSTARTSTGDKLYSIDLKPVFAAEGTVPTFRALEEGASGPDVRQLQAMLKVRGWLHSAIDGAFGASTTAAVKRWQAHEAMEATGVVEPGVVLFIAELPARLVVDSETLAPGKSVASGEPAILKLSEQPAIDAPIANDVLSEIEQGTAVHLLAGETTWTGLVRAIEAHEDGTTVATLSAPDGSSCGETCPFAHTGEDRLQLRGFVVLVPRTSGVIVPTAAIRTASDSQFVINATGRKHQVKVTATALGESVVKGIDAGTRVRISPSMSE